MKEDMGEATGLALLIVKGHRSVKSTIMTVVSILNSVITVVLLPSYDSIIGISQLCTSSYLN